MGNKRQFFNFNIIKSYLFVHSIYTKNFDICNYNSNSSYEYIQNKKFSSCLMKPEQREKDSLELNEVKNRAKMRNLEHFVYKLAMENYS